MTKRAVVVGINDYTHQVDIWPDLGGATPDADAVYHLLVHAFEFDPSEIILLKDANASSSNIRSSLHYILGQSEPGDVAFFYYAGHGGLHPGTDPSTYYQTIIPHTGRYITDWDLAQAADALPPSTVNFTVMMDCCHSGGMGDLTAQGPAARTASLTQEFIDAMVTSIKTLIPVGITLPDWSTLANNLQEVLDPLGPTACFAEEANREFVESAKSLLFSAARWDEAAHECGHGYLTQAFIDVVDSCPFTISNIDLHQELLTRVRERSAEEQSPVMRGQANRQNHQFLAPFDSSM